MIRNFIQRHKRDIIATILLFTLALGLRFTYQSNSLVDKPFRADAAKYFIAAYNLATYGTYSLDIPKSLDATPQTTTDLSPGLPLFTALFFKENSTIESVLEAVTSAQVVLGSFTVVFTFFLARLSLGFYGALFAGLLTAMSPHLISTEYYLLTETLYIFVMMLGALLFATGWLRNKPLITVLSGLFLALSTHVRTVSIFLIWFLSPLLLLLPRKRAFNNLKTTGIHLFALIMGFMIIAAAYHEFKGYAITRDSWLRSHFGQETQSEALKTAQENAVSVPYINVHNQLSPLNYPATPTNTYQNILNPLRYLKSGLTPPEFYIRDARFVNTDQQIFYKYSNKHLTTESFGDFPIQFITWNLWGKYLTFWNWDNIYIGDVYIYEMLNSAFETNLLLKSIHAIMKILHIPLYIMSLCGMLLFLIRCFRSSGTFTEQGLAVPAIGFLYFHGISTFLAWLPRYSIPVRPFSYIVAAAMMTWTMQYVRLRFSSEASSDSKKSTKSNSKPRRK